MSNFGRSGSASALLRVGVPRAALSILILCCQVLAAPLRGADALEPTTSGTDLVPQAVTDVPLTQYRRINGYLDSTCTGGTLRAQPNSGDACALNGSSTATLSGIPASGTVIAAYLYWAGSGSTLDAAITFDGTDLTADRSFTTSIVASGNTFDFFGGFEDVTAHVESKRNGNYVFTNLAVDVGDPYCSSLAVLSGWALIVIYSEPTLTGKTIVVYDGFDAERASSVSYTLNGIFASPPPNGKGSFLVWQGDPDISGAPEGLQFNATGLSDGLNPVANVYNSTINSIGSSTTYGVDLDTFNVSATINAGDTSASTTVSTGNDFVVLNAVLLQVQSDLIVGTVFEDVNYGGGAGRNLATAAASAPGFTVRRPNATVELYDAAGAYLRSTTTDANGLYGFGGLADGNYTVRVVNGSVLSSRAGAAAGQWPVQTFRSDATTGVSTEVTNEVGGTTPANQDTGANLTSANLGSFFAQSKAPVQLISGIAVTSVDFGYNFDTIVNTNDTGQGSLRQFIANANALGGEATMAQSGSRQSFGVVQALPAAKETSIFMISDSLAHPGLKAGYPNLLSGGVAVIPNSSTTLWVTGANGTNTILDGTTQTVNVGNTNAGQLGTGGTVGVDALALTRVERPEVEIRDGNAINQGLLIGAASSTVRGISIWGFGNTPAGIDGNIWIAGNGTVVEQSIVGTSAISFADPGAATRSRGNNIGSATSSNVIVRNNLVGFSEDAGVSANLALSGWLVESNEIRGNGIAHTSLDGLNFRNGHTGSTARGNLIVGNEGCGIDTFQAGGTLAIENNTITGNGVNATLSAETAGIRVWGPSILVDRNIISGNFGAGVSVVSGFAGNRITRNSIFANGTITNLGGGGPSGQLGIDLQKASDNAASGTAPYFTLNDGGDGDSGGNTLLNYPVITTAALIGTALHVRGFARPGMTIEIFRSDPDASGFGEGRTFLFSGVEGSGADTDAGTGTYGPGVVNGIVQGSDTTNRFAFSFIPLVPVTAGSSITATATDGSNNTSEFSGLATMVYPSVIKKPFTAAGTPVPDAALLPRGTLVKFLLYINNVGGAISDVAVQDVLAAGFAYVPGSIRFSNTVPQCVDLVCTPAEEATIFASADAGTVGTDPVDADIVSFTGVTLNAGNQNAANAQLNITASNVWALVFTVRMQ